MPTKKPVCFEGSTPVRAQFIFAVTRSISYEGNKHLEECELHNIVLVNHDPHLKESQVEFHFQIITTTLIFKSYSELRLKRERLQRLESCDVMVTKSRDFIADNDNIASDKPRAHHTNCN